MHRKKYLFFSLSLVAALVTAAFIFASNNTRLDYVFGLPNSYSLKIDRSITTTELLNESVTFYTTNNNSIDFGFGSETSETINDGVIKLLNNGYFYNETAITGISNISITLSKGSVELSYGNYKNNLVLGSETLNTSNGDDVVFNVVLSTPSNFFKLTCNDGSSSIKEITIKYSCSNESEPVSMLKTAVFADVQLCAKENGSGDIRGNAGSTVHAYLALRNHFQLCKKQNVDVILMDGDIVNNAIENYYELFEIALENVYGTDETKYPEIVWNMGNHEWWDGQEKETATAVSLFKQYARINTPSLVRQSNVRYSLDNNETLPTYCKVIKGIPFLVVSGENSMGEINNTMKSELTSWLNEISNLPSVQDGGPIYVAYHYPLHTSSTHGSNANDRAYVLENLLKDYPQAVVFTGDTHYSGVNERAINQVDFTTINIGSSSYSRMDTRSATMSENESFYNMKTAGNKLSDAMVGNANYMHEYTPTIHIMETMDDNSTTINRYFSTDDVDDAIHIEKSWYLPSNITKSTFKYTNSRFENTASALSLYGANGVSWPNNANLRFGVKNGQMAVIFPDTNEHHYTEHFKIEVTGNTTKTYDVVSNYYKYNLERENLYFILKDLPTGNNYTVRVTAYDYFDNPSLNYLTSSTNSPSICSDDIDDALTATYGDISSRVYFDDCVSGSSSSVEYYYNGVMQYSGGATMNKLIYSNGDVSDYLSIGNTEECEVIVKAKVKNLTNDSLTFGLTIVDNQGSWKSDFSQATRKVVSPNSGWTQLEWNLTSLYDLIGRSSISHLGLKVASSGYSADGYEMHLLLDEVDVVAGNHIDIPENPSINNIEMCNYEAGAWRGTGSSAEICYTDTYGVNSTSSRKITFRNSEGLPEVVNSSNYATVNASFNLRTSLGANNYSVDNSTLSFDIKLSDEFYASGHGTKHMFSLKIEDTSWANDSTWCDFFPGGASAFKYENTDNGWIHVEINLANKSFPKLSDGISVITFGFFGITTATQQTAYVIFDNISLSANS